MNLRSWMRRNPPATHLRFDQKKILELGKGKTKWADAERAVESYQPKLIECLNAEGHVLRVTQVEAPEEEHEEEKVPLNEKTSELVQVARIIAESNDKAVARHEAFARMAFEKNFELVQVLSDRMSGLEAAWQQSIALREAQVDEAQANASEEEADPTTSVLGNLIQLASASQNTGVPKNAATVHGPKKAGKK
jgi:hypothetical protein